MNPETKSNPSRLVEIVGLFLRLGFTAFGGPAAHIALFHDETVQRRKWLTEAQFLDLLAAVNLIPGPNSTEMAIHISYVRAGWAGLILGGAAFILPAVALVMLLAWAYIQYGNTPQVEWLLYGIKPIVIAIILQALWMLGRKAIRDMPTLLVGLLSFFLYLLGLSPLIAMLGGGIAIMLLNNWRRWQALPALLAPNWLAAFQTADPGGIAALATPFSLPVLFFTFVKIGAVLYGSGYVLLAFLRDDFVTRLGWLTDQQLLDAVAIGQVTPGPVFTTATFIGFLLAGAPGALVATLGIFLPSFIFIALSSRILPRLRSSPWTGSFLDGVIAGSLGLMAGVTLELSFSTFVDPITIAAGITAAVLLFRYKVNTTWLILGGGLVGLITALFSN